MTTSFNDQKSTLQHKGQNLKLDFLVPCASFHTFPAASREQEYEAVVQLPLPLVWGTSSQCQLAGGTSSGLLGVWSLLPGALICQIFESGDTQKEVKLN